VQIFDAFNSLEYFVLKIRHIAKAQPLSAILTATVQTSTEVQQLENNL
jgi:hypothetical protein